MKKIASIAAVALLGILVLPSCKKDYTCSCTSQIQGLNNPDPVQIKKSSKKDAKSACDDLTNNSMGMLQCELN